VAQTDAQRKVAVVGRKAKGLGLVRGWWQENQTFHEPFFFQAQEKQRWFAVDGRCGIQDLKCLTSCPKFKLFVQLVQKV
jgi:hypothetical protein